MLDERSMQVDRESSDAGQLVLVSPVRPAAGLTVAVLGSALGILFSPTINGSSLAYFIVPACLLGGVNLCVGRRLVLNKATGELIRSWEFFWLGNTRRAPLGEPATIVWEHRVTGGGSYTPTNYSYPVSLRASDGVVLHRLFTPTRSDEAERLTEEVGQFLGIERIHRGDHESRGDRTPEAVWPPIRRVVLAGVGFILGFFTGSATWMICVNLGLPLGLWVLPLCTVGGAALGAILGVYIDRLLSRRRPRDPVREVEAGDPESVLESAAMLEHRGDWDRAARLYRDVLELWPEQHGRYASNCIEEIERKKRLASP